MYSIDDINVFEDNENSWFSLWSRDTHLDSLLILMNKKLYDDHFFNHVTRIHSKSEITSKTIDEVISKYLEYNIHPCFYITPFLNNNELVKKITDKGFKESDQLYVMIHSGGDTKLKGPIDVTKIKPYQIDVWIKVFSESCLVSSNQIPEYLRRTKTISLRSDVDLFLATVYGQVAGCAGLFSKNNVGGCYFLGTIAKYRIMGVASSLLNKITYENNNRMNKILIIQSLKNDKLEQFYEKNMFKKIYAKPIYIKW